MRARAFHRKQSIYRAIEADNARAAMDGTIRVREIVVPSAPLLDRVEDRDPVEIARAAGAALRGTQ